MSEGFAARPPKSPMQLFWNNWQGLHGSKSRRTVAFDEALNQASVLKVKLMYWSWTSQPLKCGYMMICELLKRMLIGGSIMSSQKDKKCKVNFVSFCERVPL